jgi:hypothetical protein
MLLSVIYKQKNKIQSFWVFIVIDTNFLNMHFKNS